MKIRDWEAKGLKPADVREDGRYLEDELRLAGSQFRRGLDPLSLVGSMISPMDRGEALAWPIINEAAWLDPFEGDGGFLTITGAPRKGKTGIACLIIDAWLRSDPDRVVLTNVLTAGPVDRLFPTPGVRSLSQAVNRCVADDIRWLWVFDDAGLEWIKQRAMSGISIDLEQFARIVPKHGGSFIYIDQREAGIPTTISEFAESRIMAFRPGFASVRLPRLVGFVSDIPKARIPYISGARSAFLVDMDVRKLIESIPPPAIA